MPCAKAMDVLTVIRTVARKAGIAPSYLSRIENGRVQPSFRTVLRVQQALRLDLQEILAPADDNSRRRGACPVSSRGACLLDSIRPEAEVRRSTSGEFYSPREIRLLRQLALWVKNASPDRVRAMEILLQDLTERAEKKR